MVNTGKLNKGFTLIEILVTMGIFAVLLSLGLLFGIDFYKAYAFNSERQLVVGILQKARSRSLANINQSAYGVCISGSNYIIFFGSVSCDPNNSANEVYSAHPGISNTGLSVSFAQLSGRPTPANSSLTLQYDQRTAVININSEGRVDW